MAKGSQLSQLKSRLHNEGVTDRRQTSKSSKKRRSTSSSTGAAQVAAEAARRATLARITASLNPFEERVTKPKHEVLGRKIRGAVGRPGAAKAGGLKQRRETLLPEFNARHKSGAFVDRRFGEGDTTMTPEERMLERFTRERQTRAGKTNMFNLDDGEEEGLTHYGQTLSGLDEMDGIGLGMDEDEGGNIDPTATARGHFGGFGEEAGEGDDDEGPDRKKTKYEVMQEVMAKSKLAKYERQQVKEADDELRMELDDELDAVRGLLLGAPAVMPRETERPVFERAPIPGQARRDAEAAAAAAEAGPSSKPQEDPAEKEKRESDTYDAFVRELAFERRAKPQDRLKTEEELAVEEAEKLREAEANRLRRMRGEAEESDAEGGKKARRSGKAKRAPGADDLDDDLDLDGGLASDVYGLGPGLGDRESEEKDDNEDDEEEGSDDDDEDEDEDREDDFGDVADLDGLEAGEDDEAASDADEATPLARSSKKGVKGKASKGKKAAAVLPFTFPCPATHDDLLTLIDEHSISPVDVPTVIQRIRALHHASLGIDNKHKLQALLGVLLDHALFVAGSDESEGGFELVGKLVAHIYSLSKTYPTAGAQHFVSKLALMQRNLTRGLSRGALNASSKTWPGPAECALLRLAGSVWPTSDKSHAVTTPLALLIAQYMAHCRIRGLGDITSALFLASVAAANEKESKRIVPEALNVLHNVVAILAPLEHGAGKKLNDIASAFGIPTPDVGAPHTQELRLTAQEAGTVMEAQTDLSLADLLDSSVEDDDVAHVKVHLLGLAMSLIDEYAKLYTGSTAFIEMFDPFASLLALARASALPAPLSAQLTKLHDSLERSIASSRAQRRALRLQAHRAIPLASHIPKFDQQGFNPDRKAGRTFDPDVERAQAAKLKALVKKERKGAVREIRRDAQVLAEERRRLADEEDKSYQKKIHRIMGSFEDERGEQKAWEKEKAKRKRQAGGK